MGDVDSSSYPIAQQNAFYAVFSGDVMLRSYWGMSVDINAANAGDAGAIGTAPYTRIPGTVSFTVN